MDGNPRHGHRCRADRYPAAQRKAHGFRGLFIYHRRGGRTLGVRLSGLVGAARVLDRPFPAAPVYGDHRRVGIDHGVVRRCGLYPHSADHAELDSNPARRAAVDGNDHAPGIHHLRIVDLLSSRQGATWVCPAHIAWQGEAQTLAVSLLKGRSARRKPEIATRSGGRWQEGQGSPHNGTRYRKTGLKEEDVDMVRYKLILAAAILSGVALATPAAAQNEQFIPILSYRTGAYAVNGVPFANGMADYYNLINERDGGINGVKLVFEECETGYATDKGVECYERLKAKGATGAGYFSPLSTGITFALTEKVPGDKIPHLTMGYGRSESRNGAVFPWNFIAVGSYWTAADVAIQHIAHELGGIDKLKGKKISLVYHDSPYGKEPIAALEERAKLNGFTFKAIPVTHPGVEQKSQWLAIRQDRPDYVLLWGWGVMNSTAIKEAAAVAYPRDKIIGVWWSGAEPDVIPAGDQAIGYKALMLQHPAGKFAVHADIDKYVVAKNKSAGADTVGRVLYNRGLINSMLGVEAIRTAQKKYGNKPLTGEQIRWGFENLDLSAARLQELGFAEMLKPLKLSCSNHQGADQARVQQWDGKAWKIISDFYTADLSLLDPMVKETAAKYAVEKKITPRDCSKES